jgi:hypothetical protein
MRKLAIFFLGFAVLGSALMAQEYQEGIPWGNAYFRPSVEFVYTHSDNVFLVDKSMGDLLHDNIWMIRPQVGFELPFNNSYLKVDVQYEYKDYENYDLIHHDTWFAHLDSQFKFSNGSVLSVRDHYVRGVQQIEQFDPDKEVYWNNSRFTRNEAAVQYDVPVSTLNRLSVNLGHDQVKFKGDSESGTLPFFSYVQKSGGLAWKYNYQPLASLIFEWQHTKSSPKNDDYMNSPIGIYTTSKRYKEDKFLFGWEGNAQRRLSGFAKMGYVRMRFNNDYSNYKGVLADAGLTYKLTEFSDLSTTLFRHANQSAFNVNNFYSTTGTNLRFHHQFNRYLFGTLGGSYQKNSYSEGICADVDGDGLIDSTLFAYTAGQHRNDNIAQFLAEVGYHFNPRISLRFNYLYEDRSSNIKYIDIANVLRKPYSYVENRFVFQVQMGW